MHNAGSTEWDRFSTFFIRSNESKIGNIEWIGTYFLGLKFTSNEMIYTSCTMQAVLNRKYRVACLT
jgi:hypothetical protein